MCDYKLSVIIPVYNQDKFLQGCLHSVAAQTLDEIEVIIVDDGSKDQSLQIAQKFEKKYSHFTVITQKNGGRSAARNTGLDRVCGRYIAFLDSDDFVDPEMYKKLYNTAIKEDAEVVKCGGIAFDDKSNKILNFRKEFNSFTEIISNSELMKLYLNRSIDRVVWNGIYHYSLFEDLRFPGGTNYEDQYVTPNVLAKTNKFLYIPHNFYYYRKHPGAFTNSNRISDQVDKVQALNELYVILRNQKLEKNIGADYSRYFYKNVIGYHNQIIYRDPASLKKNHHSITDLIDAEAFEFVLRNKYLTQKEKQFLQLMIRSHYLYFLVQKLSRIKEMVLNRKEFFKKNSKERKINSTEINERYKEMIKQYA